MWAALSRRWAWRWAASRPAWAAALASASALAWYSARPAAERSCPSLSSFSA